MRTSHTNGGAKLTNQNTNQNKKLENYFKNPLIPNSNPLNSAKPRNRPIAV
ncbi:MAG: hypothetical protein RL246_1153 [Bacteroidota bacterium]|jgi:hypothetical protein